MSPDTKPEQPTGSGAHDDLGFALPEPARVSGRRAWLFVAAAAVVIVGAFLAGWLPKVAARRAAEAENTHVTSRLVRVELVKPKVISSDRDLRLPGSIEPVEQTVIYPRAQGYVKRWLVDLGSSVKEGELLAEIDTPELDAQLEQAKAQEAQAEADVARAEASRGFSKVNLARLERLTPEGVSSQAELDRQRAEAEVNQANVTLAKANVAAQQANLRRLAQLKGFAKITAPFAGTIIDRMIERGALVSPTSPLFKLAATTTVRVQAQVPQDVAPSVRTGSSAKVTVREFAGKTFEGTIARSAGALDDVSRTMRIEVRVPNENGQLLSGMYAQVALTLATPHRLFEVPITALYADSRGTRVATIDEQSRVVMKPIGIERDTGQTLEVSTGLDGSERIVKLANAQLTDGALVDVIVATTDAGD